MAWIEFHPSKIKKLKKFIDLRRELQWNINETLGFLGSFWGEAIEIRESGDISDWTPDYLCELTNVTLNSERVWNALVLHRWIDVKETGLILVHDWLDTAGRYLTKKYSVTNKERLVAIWSLHGKSYGPNNEETIQRPNRDPTQPNLTIPNPTKDKRQTPLNPPLVDLAVSSKRQKPIPNWGLLIDHIKRKWEYKKRPNGRFSPTAKDFAQLRKKAMVYDAFELMALYDEFVVNDDPFYSRNGHVIWVFCGAIDTLVDRQGWKAKSETYRTKHLKPETNEEKENLEKLSNTLSTMMTGKTL